MTYPEEDLYSLYSMDPYSKEKENEDNGYHILKRKNKKIGCYGSGSQGTTIRNAINGGCIFGHKVGSQIEDLYFKVIICTGESKKGPITLFYDNPEQYERHMFQVIDEEKKKAWRERANALGKSLLDKGKQNFQYSKFSVSIV